MPFLAWTDHRLTLTQSQTWAQSFSHRHVQKRLGAMPEHLRTCPSCLNVDEGVVSECQLGVSCRLLQHSCWWYVVGNCRCSGGGCHSASHWTSISTSQGFSVFDSLNAVMRRPKPLINPHHPGERLPLVRQACHASPHHLTCLLLTVLLLLHD